MDTSLTPYCGSTEECRFYILFKPMLLIFYCKLLVLCPMKTDENPIPSREVLIQIHTYRDKEF